MEASWLWAVQLLIEPALGMLDQAQQASLAQQQEVLKEREAKVGCWCFFGPLQGMFLRVTLAWNFQLCRMPGVGWFYG